MKTITVLFLFIFALGSNLRAQIEVSSAFQPAVVTEGEPSLYRIEFSSEGGRSTAFYNSAPPRIPSVDGLRFQYIGPSHETRIINGRTSIRTSHLYRAEATQPGEYTVPAFAFQSGSFQAEIPAASLQVLDRTASQAPDGTSPRRPAWLEIRLPRENLYVGETTPIGVRLFLDSRQVTNASLAAEHPEKVGDAFSIGEFGTMSQSQISLDGLPVTVADWTVLLTPLKTGAQPLLFELPLAVSLRDSNRRNSPFDSFFGGPSPFQQMFNRESIRAYSEDREIEILPLPTENRPDDFTGGIGSFQVEQTRISSTTVQAGEPLLFSIEISGQGNFDRLEAPVLQSDTDRWRSYDPETSFTPRDNLGYAGVKSFTFTLIPRSEEITSTPDFTFSYFDPESGEYQTVQIPPSSLQVDPPPAGSFPRRETERSANPVEVRRGPDLLPLQYHWSGGSASALLSPYRSAGFWIAQGAAGLFLAGAYFLLRHRMRLREDPDYARRNRARRASRRFRLAAHSHATAGHIGPFFESACRALQESVGPFQRGEPESLTENNVASILATRGYGVEVLEEVHHFFAAAESIQYGGREAGAANLEQENQRLQNLLKSLHGKRSAKRSVPASMANLILIAAALLLSASGLPAQDAVEENSVDAQTIAKSTDPVTDPREAAAVFRSGTEAYEAESFEEAAEDFRSLVPRFSSSSVHYNLGNTLYRLREYPEAILHYEKAFALDPSHPDIRANLNLAREAASVETPVPPPLAFIGHRLPWTTWTWIVAVSVWGLAATLLLSRPTGLASIWRNSLLLLFGLLLALSLMAQVTWFATANRAIVLTNDTPLRIAPTASSPLEARLPAGSQVNAKESYGDYYRIRLPDGTEGWVLQSTLKKVR